MPNGQLEKIAFDALGNHLIVQYCYEGKTIIKILTLTSFDDVDKALEEGSFV